LFELLEGHPVCNIPGASVFKERLLDTWPNLKKLPRSRPVKQKQVMLVVVVLRVVMEVMMGGITQILTLLYCYSTVGYLHLTRLLMNYGSEASYVNV